MIEENVSTLKIHKLSKEQYERELAAGRIDEYALYLTPDTLDENAINNVLQITESLTDSTCLGNTPLTTTEAVERLKLIGDGECEYSLQSNTVFDMESSDPTKYLNVSLVDCGEYYELRTTGSTSAWYGAYMDFVISGLVIGEEYTLNVDTEDCYEVGVCSGTAQLYASSSMSSSELVVTITPNSDGFNTTTFTATTETVYLRFYPASNYYYQQGITTARFKSLYINRANGSVERTAVVNESGTFTDYVALSSIPAGVTVFATPECSVYSAANTISAEDIVNALGYSPLDLDEVFNTRNGIIKDYTNQIPLSVDENGDVFNEYGYSTGTMDDAGVVSEGNSYVTGFIPVERGDVIRIKIPGAETIDSNVKVALYSADRSTTSGQAKYMLAQNTSNTAFGAISVEGDTLVWDTTDINYWLWNDMAWLRVQYWVADAIITVNEEITESAKDELILKPAVKVTKDSLDFDISGGKPLTGKTVVCFGDSLFGMYRDSTSAPANIADYTGATVHNVGFGGCRMSVHPSTGYAAFSMWALAKAIADNDWLQQDVEASSGASYFPEQLEILESIDFSSVDMVVIHYGTNDFAAGGGTAIDNSDDPYDYTTLCGALRYSIETLLGAYPKLQIYVSLPVFRFWEVDGETVYSDDYVYHDHTLPEFVEALRGVATEYKLPVIDGYNGMGINKHNAAAYLSDGTHHNDAGRKLFGEFIGGHLISKHSNALNSQNGSASTISWNDLADRPFYAEWEQGIVFDNGTITFNEEDGSYISTDKIVLREGETYTVTWQGDSDVYTCVCDKLVDAESNMSVYMLGNTTVAGGSLETDDPFLIGTVVDANGNVQGTTIIALDGSTNACPVITGAVEVIHEIPERYIPSDVYYVDFEMPDLQSIIAITPFEDAYNAITSGRYVVIGRVTASGADSVSMYRLASYRAEDITFDNTGRESDNGIRSYRITYNSDGRVQIDAATANRTNQIPDCNLDDNGKFLRVIDGSPAWTSIPNAEEASF